MQVRFCLKVHISEILRLGDFQNYNQFLWNAYWATSVRPDVSHPHFQFDFPQICTATFSFDKELDPFLGLHDPILSGGFYPEAPTQKSSQQKSWSGLDALIYIALTFNLVICK